MAEKYAFGHMYTFTQLTLVYLKDSVHFSSGHFALTFEPDWSSLLGAISFKADFKYFNFENI